jgi:Phasin protein
LIPSTFLDAAAKQIESLLMVQTDLMQTFEGMNHELFNHARKEAEIASEFVSKLAGVRSIPDATSTYQEWATKKMDLLAADGHQMLVHGEKFMQTSRRLFANGMRSAGA